jgi:hypothetical protein
VSKLFRNVPILTSLEMSLFKFWLFFVGVGLVRSEALRSPKGPPEIGDMTNLEEFDPYTSRCLHWFPYEITRCKHLTRSRISTRCLYGNYKYRPPFPRLPQISAALAPAACSVCSGRISADWISNSRQLVSDKRSVDQA